MKKSNLRKVLAILNILFFAGTLTVNALANILPINNITTGAVSDLYPNLFVPAGITFSIWGLIYLLLTAFVIYQIIFIFKNQKPYISFIDKIGIMFIFSCSINMGWIFAWHYKQIPLAMILMIFLLWSLIVIYMNLQIGKSKASRTEKILVHLPFSIYLGWISIAAIANVTDLLIYEQWNNFNLSESFWTILVISVGIILALLVLFLRNDPYYGLVFVWAFLGIIYKRLTVDPEPITSIIVTAGVGCILILSGFVFQLIRKKVYLISKLV